MCMFVYVYYGIKITLKCMYVCLHVSVYMDVHVCVLR